MAQTPVRIHAQRENHQQYARMTHPNPQRHVVPTVVLTRSKLVPLTAARPVTTTVPQPHGNPHHALKNKGVIDSGCSRHMIENMSYLSDFEEINGGYIAFGGNPKGGKITSKGKIRTGKLDFDDVYFIKELKLNLFSVSQMCDKKNSVLFTDTECIVLSPEIKLPDENQVLLRETLDESNLWHRRPGHIYFKTMNKQVKGSGPTWLFDIDTLTKSMNYQPVTAGYQSNPSAGVQEQFDAEKAGEDNVQQYLLFLLWSFGSIDPQNTDGDVTFEVKEPEFEGRKPESEVYVSPSSSVIDWN
nr:hypothetical protein [Tanacetum cinerariifolium]